MPAGRRRLPRATFSGPALSVAPRLLGAVLVHASPAGRVAVRLTEVEAYHAGDDPGSHAYQGRTARNQVMFGPAGHLYVYFTYGMHWCANVVCGPDGRAGAVLLRAGEVVDGIDLARARRPACRRDVDLARGPARLAVALGVAGDHDGVDLCADDAWLWLEPAPAGRGGSRPPAQVRSGPRVGVSGPGGDGAAYPWRFWLAGEASVSAYRAAVPRRRARPGPDTLGGDPPAPPEGPLVP